MPRLFLCGVKRRRFAVQLGSNTPVLLPWNRALEGWAADASTWNMQGDRSYCSPRLCGMSRRGSNPARSDACGVSVTTIVVPGGCSCSEPITDTAVVVVSYVHVGMLGRWDPARDGCHCALPQGAFPLPSCRNGQWPCMFRTIDPMEGRVLTAVHAGLGDGNQREIHRHRG